VISGDHDYTVIMAGYDTVSSAVTVEQADLIVPTIQLNQSTAVKSLSIEENSVYPNPTTGMLNTSATKVMVYDIKGIVVATYTDVAGKVDLSDLPAGLYFVKLDDQEVIQIIVE